MARPKKYKSGSKVLSYRVPIAAEKNIRKLIEQFLEDWNRPIIKDHNKPTNEIKPYEQPKENFTIETKDLEKEAMKRITELSRELANPPQNTIIGVKTWVAVRQQELDKLKNQFGL